MSEGQTSRRGRRPRGRLGVDIGGTFTDAALEVGPVRHTSKVLTTHGSPDDAVLEAIEAVLASAAMTMRDLDLVIHGTTLATNAIIERKGARTGLLTTAGFRDVVQIGLEHRFDLYDLLIDFPEPLVPRRLRLPVRERVAVDGRVLLPLDEATVLDAASRLEQEAVEAVAVGLLHSYANPAHEERVGEILAKALPQVAISLSSEIAPEMREYERFSTACANAYVQPKMASYLGRLEARLRENGMSCPLLLMLSGGGLTTVETASRFPVRLVESGPAGGAVFAAAVAAENGLSDVVSFDMGGTTAKVCLIDGGRPQTSRSFEVARMYRFKKGSGMPLRIPVIEMVEIGAGGGSIARIDSLGRVAVGPESAGSEPGPVSYGRGGGEPTVTDADLVLGRIHPDGFAGGRFPLDRGSSERAIDDRVGRPLAYGAGEAAAAVVDVVEENMAAAARVHAIESGKTLNERALIAFGGAAPLHVASVARKLGIKRFLVPPAAGVGSAVGFLRAPVAYEIARSKQQRLSQIDLAEVNSLLTSMSDAAHAVVKPVTRGERLTETRTASMRYLGQGHEITVPVPARALALDDRGTLGDSFEARYLEVYGRTVPGAEVEVLTWSVLVSAPTPAPPERGQRERSYRPKAAGSRPVFDAQAFALVPYAIHRRTDLRPGAVVPGPAIIEEDETSTVVPEGMTARILPSGAILAENPGVATSRRTARDRAEMSDA